MAFVYHVFQASLLRLRVYFPLIFFLVLLPVSQPWERKYHPTVLHFQCQNSFQRSTQRQESAALFSRCKFPHTCFICGSHSKAACVTFAYLSVPWTETSLCNFIKMQKSVSPVRSASLCDVTCGLTGSLKTSFFSPVNRASCFLCQSRRLVASLCGENIFECSCERWECAQDSVSSH